MMQTRTLARLARTAAVCAALALIAPDSSAESLDDVGVLNPEEMTLATSIAKAARGEVSMVVCAQGYLVTKQGNHADARTIFENCAAAGYTRTMTWMSYMETNGFGGRENAKAAAEWDRRAAEAGDPVGAFNYGLDLLRGHGVAPDVERGRHYIDRAAEAGLADAIRLQEADYRPETETPDADAWRYHKGF